MDCHRSCAQHPLVSQGSWGNADYQGEKGHIIIITIVIIIIMSFLLFYYYAGD